MTVLLCFFLFSPVPPYTFLATHLKREDCTSISNRVGEFEMVNDILHHIHIYKRMFLDSPKTFSLSKATLIHYMCSVWLSFFSDI